MMMIKDNHIAAAGGIKAAVQRADDYIVANGLQVGKMERMVAWELKHLGCFLFSGRSS